MKMEERDLRIRRGVQDVTYVGCKIPVRSGLSQNCELNII